MGYMTKNRSMPDKWVIGGELAIEGEGTITKDGAPIDLSNMGASGLALGTTASTAAPGNHTHTAAKITATAVSQGTSTNVQGILEELAARIKSLEDR